MNLSLDECKSIVSELFTNTESLMNHVYWVQQDFKLLPQKDHFGTCINYIDLEERKDDFLKELINTIIEWVYNSSKADYIINDLMNNKQRSKYNAISKLHTIAFDKFRHRDPRPVFLQGQFGELLLFNFIQYFYDAVPLIRKMPITTSSGLERFGADAIHYKVENEKNIFILGESKAYTSGTFRKVFSDSITSIINTVKNLSEELELYLYDDFLDDRLVEIADSYKNSTIQNAEIHLVCLIVYNENTKIDIKEEKQIKNDIISTIENHCKSLRTDIFQNIEKKYLPRMNYIIFPVWHLEDLIIKFQTLIGR